MAVYVPGYQHDVFVSYAHVDDEDISLSKDADGWVTTLQKQVRILLGGALGRANAYDLWIDHQLRGHEPLTADILAHLRGSALLLLILSRGYVDSIWCQQEMENFIAEAGVDSGRIFIVEHNKVVRPPALKDLAGYTFWITESDHTPIPLGTPGTKSKDPEYHTRLRRLVHHMAEKLQSLKEPSQKDALPVSHSSMPAEPVLPELVGGNESARATVFLAEVPGSLEQQREEVYTFLEDHNITVLPRTSYRHLTDATSLHSAIQADLKQATLFVQLLDQNVPIKRLTLCTPHLQHSTAQELGTLPIMQWQANNTPFDIEAITDETHRQLCKADTITVSNLAEFMDDIVQRLQTIEEDKRQEQERRQQEEERRKKAVSLSYDRSAELRHVTIFVHRKRGTGDKISGAIAEALNTIGVEARWIVDSRWLVDFRSAPERRKYIATHFVGSHALIMIFDPGSPAEFMELWNHYRQIISKSRAKPLPLKVITICKLSSEDPPATFPMFHEVEIEDLRSRQFVSTFVQKLQS